MRSLGGSGSKTISATPRQLESLIRISQVWCLHPGYGEMLERLICQALAKMRLCDTVTRADVDEAIRLMKVATQTAATDPRTGTIDMDMITTGRTALDRDQVLKFADEVLDKRFIFLRYRFPLAAKFAELAPAATSHGRTATSIVIEEFDSSSPGFRSGACCFYGRGGRGCTRT